MNAHVQPPGASAAKPINAESARSAFDLVAAMEDNIARLAGLLRMITIIDLDNVCPDARDAHALTEIVSAADEAIEGLREKHAAAFHSLCACR